MTKRGIVVLAAALMLVGTGTALAGNNVSITGYVDSEFSARQADLGADSEWNTKFGDASEVLLWATTDPSEDTYAVAEVTYSQLTNAISLDQAMMDWMIAGDSFVARFGKFYAPFGIEEESRYATTNRLISRPSAGAMPGGVPVSILNAWTDNGLGAHGMSDWGGGNGLEWNLAIGNGLIGTGAPGAMVLMPQTTAGVNKKGFVGGVNVTPTEGSQFGGSVAYGTWGGDNAYTIFGGHAQYGMTMDENSLDFRGQVAFQTMAKAGVAAADQSGLMFYGQGAYRMAVEGVEYVELVARFGWNEPNSDVTDDETSQIAIGGTVSPVEDFLIKAEFDINNEPTAMKADNNALSLLAVFGW